MNFQEFRRLSDSIEDIAESNVKESLYFNPDASKYSLIESSSFDKKFVEKVDNILMTKLDAGWSDLGSWVSLAMAQKDPNNKITIYTDKIHERTDKPWGFFENLMETSSSKVKLISVFSGEKLSLQKHKHRVETWYVIQGKAQVTRGNERFELEAGDSVTIEKNQVHRLESTSVEDLEVIEIQTGSYFGEDDIVRLEDSYGRKDIH